MKAMMKRLGSMFLVFLLGLGVVLGTFQVSGNYFAGKSYISKVSQINGEVVYADAGNIAIQFDSEVVNGKGDVTIASFIRDSDGKSFQLKPLLIPQASGTKTSTIIFPISDIANQLELKVYAIEIYVKNSKYASEYIMLPLVTLDFNKWFEIPEEKEKL